MSTRTTLRFTQATLAALLGAQGAVAQLHSPDSGRRIDRYRATVLGTLGGDESSAWEINERGQVVGSAEDADGRGIAVLWEDGELIRLGTLPGDTQSWAQGINERGDVVGTSRSPANAQTAWIWQNGEMTSLGTLGGEWSSAFDISGSTVIGWSLTGGPRYRYQAFESSGSQMITLGTVPGGTLSQGTAINRLGHVVGFAEDETGTLRAMEWAAGDGMRPLPGLNGLSLQSFADDINDAGWIVGYADTGEIDDSNPVRTHAFHAVRWKGGVIDDLGTLGGRSSRAHAVSPQGAVVGWSETPAGTQRAFLWRGGRMIDLNGLVDDFSGVVLNARSINGRGWIVGDAEVGSRRLGVVLQPTR